MSIFVRKISRPKWPDYKGGTPPLSAKDTRADAITGCLRTKEDTLSIWEVTSPSDIDIEEAILALITSKSTEKLDKLDIVYFDTAVLKSYSLNYKQSDGNTVITGLMQFHHDIIDLTYLKLGDVAQIIQNCLQNGSSKFYTIQNQINIIDKAIKGQRLSKVDLNAKLQALLP